MCFILRDNILATEHLNDLILNKIVLAIGTRGNADLVESAKEELALLAVTLQVIIDISINLYYFGLPEKTSFGYHFREVTNAGRNDSSVSCRSSLCQRKMEDLLQSSSNLSLFHV